MRPRLLIALAVAVLVVGLALLGGVLADRGGQSQATPTPLPPPTAGADAVVGGFSQANTEQLVARLERQVADQAPNADTLTSLGLAYEQRVRETGDASDLPRAEAALNQALALNPRQGFAVTGLASLAATRHQFTLARDLAVRARKLLPYNIAPLGLLGDATGELGHPREAFAAFNRMAAMKPTLSSYLRVAYGRELTGDVPGAIDATKLAVDVGSSVAEQAAYTLYQLGNLEFNQGRLAAADRAYRQALDRLPGYVYAVVGVARVEAARGNVDAAVRGYRDALDRVPLPEFASGLALTLRGAGREAEARDVDGLVDTTVTLLNANGVNTDLEVALYQLDRGADVAAALRLAETGYAERKSTDAEDILAFALYKNDRCDEARTHSVLALRLGTRDALKYFHRGLIEGCLGDRAAQRTWMRRAVRTNPYFSPLYAPVARRLAAGGKASA